MQKKKVSFDIPLDVLERLDKIAEVAEIDRAKLIVNILDETSKSMITVNKLGILHFSVIIRDMGEKMKEWADGLTKKKKFKEIEFE